MTDKSPCLKRAITKGKNAHTSSRCMCLKVAMIQCVVDGLVVAVRAELELVPLLVGRLVA